MELARRYLGLLGCVVAIAACEPVTTNFATTDYSATATVTYTWQVRYNRDDGRDRPNDTRLEKFASVSLANQNGVRPGLAVTGPDEAGLWWPALPPKPTVDDVEVRQNDSEQPEVPELIKSVDYQFTFDQAGQTVTLPTSSKVYRQAVKAHANQRPLNVILGPRDQSVINAEIQ
ncbi:hypothetical protein IQ260_06505 [Leptolyngbya cf. ectocarpi LEGE 11479]|uniref:Lipoprotein n=1 Tax=Leptolyngbya cf. ectocarpi LEGE 11479 TaxID=1828722 RepID=A0A928WZH1_LEPEC|nr:hypothetical protein [Leptolyngbya ectocarpi]MBE9066300.1 hypothetical protein [Leptolyngbya cf. ectocarpi LEGE 11479]